MKKALIGLIVVLILTMSCMFAAFPASASDINYEDFEIIDGVLIEYIGEGGDVVIPSTDADGNPVTWVDSRAFYGCTELTSVVVPEGIEGFGYSVFEGCSNLTEATLPYSLGEASYNVFKGTSLFSIVIPGNLKVIPSSFITSANCSDVVISPGVEEFRVGALYIGKACTELIFPYSVYRIDASAFCYFALETSLYFCNPEVQLGLPNDYAAYSEKTSPIIWNELPGAKPNYKFYCTADSTVKEFVKECQQGIITTEKGKEWSVNAAFIRIDEEKIEELQKECAERGVQKPKAPEENGQTDGGDETPSGDNNDNTANDGAQGGQPLAAQNDSTVLIVIIIAAVFVILIICTMVVVLVLLKAKKKKKKKKVKAEPEKAIEEKQE